MGKLDHPDDVAYPTGTAFFLVHLPAWPRLDRRDG